MGSWTEKLRRPMSGKQWSLVLVTGAAFVMIVIAAVNYMVDPYGYFHSAASDGELYYLPSKTYNMRLFDYEYFQENHAEYKGVIIGGSKGMQVSAEHLSSLRGIPYYNLSAEQGNFKDYLSWVRWLADHTQIQEIFLNLSTLEVDMYTEEDRNADDSGYYMPAGLDREKSKAAEFMQYLYRGGIWTSTEYMKQKIKGTLSLLSLKEWHENIPYMMIQERKQDPYNKIVQVNGNLADRLYHASAGKYNEMPAIERNLTAIKEIKEICDHAGIRLEIVYANTYIGQYLLYESPKYWDYLKKFAQITDYWDFSFLNAYNRNPYNFLDEGHAHSNTLNCMLNQIYGTETREDFGEYVTVENIDLHIKKRQQKYNRLLSEYRKTGKVRLGTAFEDSYLMNDLIYPTISNISSSRVLDLPFQEYLMAEQHFYAGFDQLYAIGLYLEELPEKKAERGMLRMQIYDDTKKHVLGIRNIDTADMVNEHENLILFDNLELTEGHWYSLVFTYEAKIQEDKSHFVFVEGAATDQMYLDLDGIISENEIKMNIYRPQTLGNYLFCQAKLKTDQMRGEGERETDCISDSEVYMQTFTADCEMLSYIQVKAKGQDGTPAAEDDSDVIFELKDPDGNIIGRKKVMETLLQNAGIYNLAMDGDIYLQKGKVYSLCIFAGQPSQNGLKLMTHRADEANGSILYRNGKKTADSLCFRIYGLDSEQIRRVTEWECTQKEHTEE